MNKSTLERPRAAACYEEDASRDRKAGSIPRTTPPPDQSAGIISPYIGVTGFMEAAQVMQALSAMPANSDRKLMIGVLASSITLSNQPNKLPGRFPEIGRIGDIFVEHPLAFNVIHYATREPDTLLSQLNDVAALAPDLIHGIQLNMIWPDPKIVSIFKHQKPGIRLILQIGPKAFDAVQRRPYDLGLRLKEYKGAIDYVLLDDSGGYGKAMDPEFLLPFMRRIRACKLDMGMAVAGGLYDRNLQIITPIVKEFPGVSFDGEGNLRDEERDCLDMDKVVRYVIISAEFLIK